MCHPSTYKTELGYTPTSKKKTAFSKKTLHSKQNKISYMEIL